MLVECGELLLECAGMLGSAVTPRTRMRGSNPGSLPQAMKHMLATSSHSHGSAFEPLSCAAFEVLVGVAGVAGVERLRGVANTMTLRHMPWMISSDVMFFFDMLSILA